MPAKELTREIVEAQDGENSNIDAMWKKFDQVTDGVCVLATQSNERRQLAIKTLALENEVLEATTELVQARNQKLGLPPTASLLDAANQLSADAQAAQKAAEAARQEKERLKAEKNLLSEKLANTKKAIEQTLEEHRQLEAQINDPSDLPTILKLLKSHSQHS